MEGARVERAGGALRRCIHGTGGRVALKCTAFVCSRAIAQASRTVTYITSSFLFYALRG